MTAHPDQPIDLFICHATVDGAVAAQELARDLERRGARCWIAPRDIPPGMSWPAAIVAGIEASLAMLLVVSSGAGASPEIEKEVTLAAHLRKPILPVRLADVQLSGSLLYHLQSRQWRDLFADRERVLDEVAAQVAALRGRGAVFVATKAQPSAKPPKDLRPILVAGTALVAVLAAAAYWFLAGSKTNKDPAPLTVAILADGVFTCTGVALGQRLVLTTDYCSPAGKTYSIRFGDARETRIFPITGVVERTPETGSTILAYDDPDKAAPAPDPGDVRIRAPQPTEPAAVLTFADRWSSAIKSVDADCGIVAAHYQPTVPQTTGNSRSRCSATIARRRKGLPERRSSRCAATCSGSSTATIPTAST